MPAFNIATDPRTAPAFQKRAAQNGANEYEFNEKHESKPPNPAANSLNSCNSYSYGTESNPPKLPDAALYGVLGDIVRAVLPTTEADAAALYAQLLAGTGNLIGKSPFFLADGSRHHANFFVIIAGRTAKARKGTSWANVRNVLDAIDTDWLANRVKSGLTSGEGVTEVFKDDAERRLLLFEGEFASVLQAMKRDGSTVSSLLRQAWDGVRLAVMRRKDPIDIEGAYISMIGHITLPELHRLLASVEMSNGLANRCLWVHADRSKLLPDGGHAINLGQHIERLRRAVESARCRDQVHRDDAARTLWREIYAQLSEPPAGRWGDVVCRAEAQVMRLALLLALLDESQTIGTRHLEAALLFWKYCEGSARHIFAATFANPKAARLWEALAAGPMSKTQCFELFGKNIGKQELDTILAELGESIVTYKDGDATMIKRAA